MSEQELRNRNKPNPQPADVPLLLSQHWNLSVTHGSIKQIESYDDANFLCTAQNSTGSSDMYLVKFYNAIETASPTLLHGLSSMLSQINSSITSAVQVPSIIAPLAAAEDYIIVENCLIMDGTTANVALRVFPWIHGTTLSRCIADIDILEQAGKAIGKVYQSLSGFDHQSFHRSHLWDLAQFSLSIPLISYVEDDSVRSCIETCYELYQNELLVVSNHLPKSVIMADCNDANIIVSEENSVEIPRTVVGLIDFSDAVYTWSVNEIAIAMAYALLGSFGKESPYIAMASLLAGYVKVAPLSEIELEWLPLLIKVRLCISIMCGACAISKDPSNEYLKLHAVPARNALVLLSSTNLKSLVGLFNEVQIKALEGNLNSVDSYTLLVKGSF